ncbi:MAG: hypothetical protein LQ340_004620 [Diploschistes diacapsis]|nr:MAG: hypothetical protein LQ340_004620 [Diploschistes diacapsis]
MSTFSPEINLLRRQFLQLLDPSALNVPESQVLKRPEIQNQIYALMFRDDSLQYSPPSRYRLRVLKLLVTALENAMDDPDEDQAQRKCYVTYTAPSPLLAENSDPPPTVTLLESPNLLASSGTTGLRTWEAAKYLTTFLCLPKNQARYINGRAVVELGAGTGLVSLSCAKWLGARYVLATDGSGDVVDGLAESMFLNGLDGTERIDSQVVKWGHGLDGEILKDEEGEKAYGLVLGADVTFDDRLITPLVSTLHGLFDRYPGIEALVAATVRNEETLDTFVKACTSRRFATTIIASSTDQGQQEPQLGLFHSLTPEIRIYGVRRDEPR